MPKREYLPDGRPLMTPREVEIARLAARLERLVWSPYPRIGIKASATLRRVRARLAAYEAEYFTYQMKKSFLIVGVQP